VKTEVKNKRITILGAARSGIAAAKLLKKHGAKVYVSDAAPAENKMKEAAELDKAGIAYEFGMHSEQSLLAELVVLSPGIPVRSDVVQSFIKRKVPVLS
jgi:UDP-N-acetylmuramoylalanine--D-glutamate ligase